MEFLNKSWLKASLFFFIWLEFLNLCLYLIVFSIVQKKSLQTMIKVEHKQSEQHSCQYMNSPRAMNVEVSLLYWTLVYVCLWLMMYLYIYMVVVYLIWDWKLGRMAMVNLVVLLTITVLVSSAVPGYGGSGGIIRGILTFMASRNTATINHSYYLFQSLILCLCCAWCYKFSPFHYSTWWSMDGKFHCYTS